MSDRKALVFLVFVSLALLVSASAVAAERPSTRVAKEDFLASLRAPETPGPEQPNLGPPAPIFKHGYNCYYIGTRVCVPCEIGKATDCDDYECYYAGQWHVDSICYACANYC